MIERLGVHRFDDGDVIRHLGQARQQFRKLRARLAMLRELELGAKQCRAGINERGPIAFHQLGGRRFAVPFGQFRFVVK